MKNKGINLEHLRKTTFYVEPPRRLNNKSGRTWDWERDIRVSNGQQIVREYIIRSMSHDVVKSVPRLQEDVADNIGHVTVRSIHRNIKMLMQDGIIRQISDDDVYGYVLAGKRRDICQVEDDYEDIDQAA